LYIIKETHNTNESNVDTKLDVNGPGSFKWKEWLPENMQHVLVSITMMFATDQASNYASNNRRVVDLVKTNDMDEPYSDFRDYPEEDDYSNSRTVGSTKRLYEQSNVADV